MLDGNNLLAALRRDDLERLEPLVTECRLALDSVIYEPGTIVEHAYFPRWSAVASFAVMLEDGLEVETAMVGREGALGGIVSHGNMPAYARCDVIHEGSFYRIATRDLEHVKQQSPAMANLFARYADCMLAQVFQSVACNAVHLIEQRAAKWLCAALDRTGKHSITMTQEQLASMMGIGRSYASRVLQKLKAEGLIATRRGGIEVLDAERLNERACDCNAYVQRHFDTVLKGVYPE